MKELVERGDWLTNKTKRSLAEWVVIRARRKETLRPWVEGLPGDLNSLALAALDEFREEELTRVEVPPELSDLRKLSDFLNHQSRNQPFSTADWTAAELQRFQKDVSEMSPEEAGRLYGKVWVGHFPLSIRVLLIPEILANSELVHLGAIRMLVKKTTEEFADARPAAAASWAMGLEPEALRVLAAGIVADRWKSQNADEARAWVMTLPEPMQKRFGY
jgi:hypothetical protein